MIITCPIHGDFEQIAGNHLRNEGCPHCAHEYVGKMNALTYEEFVRRAEEVHGGKYIYTKVIYVNQYTPVTIICPIHGEFQQIPVNHINGAGCIYCNGKMVNNREEFIKKAREIHGDKYDYSKVIYVNQHTPVIIICPIHGEFLQKPAEHLCGRGCKYCKHSELEDFISNYLEKMNIKFIRRCRRKDLEWIDNLELDFYLPDYNVAIECQGEQHFRPITFGSTKKTKEEMFDAVLMHDNKKMNLCKENNCRLFYFSNLLMDYPYQVYMDVENMMNDIISGVEIKYSEIKIGYEQYKRKGKYLINT